MHRALLIATALIFAHSAGAQSTRDSAGVRLIRYAQVNPSADLVLSTPSLTLSQDKCELNRVVGVIIQRSGGIIVANGGNKELCLFDAKGAFVRKVGRKGSGPGEFVAIGSLTLGAGDSLVVVDPLLRRLSVFAPSGDLGREVPIIKPDSVGSQSFVTILRDGTLIMGFSTFKSGAPRPEAVMLEQRLVRMSPKGTAAATLGTFPMGEHFIQAAPPSMGGVAYWDLAFGRSFSAAPFADGLIAGDGSDEGVREYSSAGKLIAIHQTGLARREVTPADIAAYRDAELAGSKGADRPRTEKMVDEMPFPKRFPAYHRLLTENFNRTWIETDSRRWLRLDPAKGTATGVRVPAHFRLLAVQNGRACGVGRDDLDVETVFCFAVGR